MYWASLRAVAKTAVPPPLCAGDLCGNRPPEPKPSVSTTARPFSIHWRPGLSRSPCVVCAGVCRPSMRSSDSVAARTRSAFRWGNDDRSRPISLRTIWAAGAEMPSIRVRSAPLTRQRAVRSSCSPRLLRARCLVGWGCGSRVPARPVRPPQIG